MTEKCLQVALDVPLDRLFSYGAGEFNPQIGERVLVPFGPRRLSGIVLATGADPGEYAGKLRSILACPADMPPLPEQVLALCRFVASYYHHPLGAVLAAAVPVVFRGTASFSPPDPEYLYQAGDLQALLSAIGSRAPARLKVAELLAVPVTAGQLRSANPAAMRWVRDWQAAGFVQTTTAEADSAGETLLLGPQPPLNAEQQAAVAAIAAATGFAPFLLYGITGSGKTEVYLQAIASQLAAGRQVLVLVPEINLTPQLEQRFRQRFPAVLLASLHSGLNDRQRALAWLDATQGRAKIVLGTRLSVFTPLPQLGLIVVDEEHDPSYKQQDGVRYSARDVAVYRARQSRVPVVLGSATPSLETWQNAQAKRYTLLPLTRRAVKDATLPAIRLLPVKKIRAAEGLHPLAREAVERALQAGRQALVFINRRGYAPVLACTECGWMASCRHCAARLVLHLGESRLRCHHCGFEEAVTPACPDCGNHDLQPVGHGTQRLEDIVAKQFPGARVLRIDRDSTRRKGELDAALKQVHDGDADILIGTQMLAKGHDFPRLSCVVILNADTGLYSMDFRAEERLFALLTQVAGRAGRHGQGGEVLIQTLFEDHPFYAQLLDGDYARLAQRLLAERRQLRLPPFTQWAILRAEAPQLPRVQAFLDAARLAFPHLRGLVVHEPVAASMTRRAGHERMQLLLVADTRAVLHQAMDEALPRIAALPDSQIRWSLDVDPLEV
ncbi:primosomal protein N' [Chitinilyticum piscinae]|uniref:Replication restart protein PriA n=1 Tax=Chitinilyticum piscinae TaxID=2866724 RepID=A0A8J7FJH9_9NEIS|nr:primosomal protein N' [Chitinilyticum piscinae]MBE9608682.1 primosomal protein N' [Chitinilyticum piscinae]